MASHSMGYVGRIGNVIHYKVGNQFYSRSAPKKFKQTKATKAAASVFGKGSIIASAIRSILMDVLPNPTDRKMQLRLVSAVLEWLHLVDNEQANPGNQPVRLTGFSFAGEGPALSRRWKVDIQVTNPQDGLILISIPAFVPNKSIAAPENTISIICTMATGVCDLASGREIEHINTELEIAYDDTIVPKQTFSMELPTPKGSLIVAGIALVYKTQKTRYIRTNSNKSYMPSEIVHAIYL